MSSSRRSFLVRTWQVAAVVGVGLGGVLTLNMLKPRRSDRQGSFVDGGDPRDLPTTGVVDLVDERISLVRHDDDVKALSQVCPHLGCAVGYCESSGQFECPCHGSTFNRIGEYRSGPSPRGLDRFGVSLADDGHLMIDTAMVIDGPPPGDETIDEPVTGPSCGIEEG